VMQRNVWYKKVQMKNDWEAHMSMWCKEKWYEIWYVWKCKWEMDEKYTCLCDTINVIWKMWCELTSQYDAKCMKHDA